MFSVIFKRNATLDFLPFYNHSVAYKNLITGFYIKLVQAYPKIGFFKVSSNILHSFVAVIHSVRIPPFSVEEETKTQSQNCLRIVREPENKAKQNFIPVFRLKD